MGFFDNPWITADTWLIPSLTAMLWTLVLYSLSFLFLSVPEKVRPQMKWRRRWSLTIRRTGKWLLAVLFLSLSAALLILSYQLLRVFLS